MMTVDTLLETLEWLAGQARRAAAQTGAAEACEADNLTELAGQLQRLVNRAYAQMA